MWFVLIHTEDWKMNDSFLIQKYFSNFLMADGNCVCCGEEMMESFKIRQPENFILWRLIASVDLTKPMGAGLFGQILFWVYLWGWFWMRLTFEPVEWGKRFALPNMVASANQLKSPIEQIRHRRNSSCWTALSWDTKQFWSFELKMKHWLFLGCQPASF
jgi:hypothetical protein